MYTRVLFLGSKKSGLNVLKTIYGLKPEAIIGCVTFDDSADVRSELEEFKLFCGNNNLDIEVLDGVCDITECVEKYRPDLCIVMGWYYLIKPELLKKIKGGFIGIHNSLLPKYRGFAPTVWAMINGEKEAGFSVFSFDNGMDTGKLWYQKRIVIDQTDYIQDLLSNIDDEVNAFFLTSFLDIIDGKLQPYEQPDINPSYCAKRTPSDGKIDWSQSASDIYNFIRAQSKPYPGAYTMYDNKLLRIWRARPFEYELYGGVGQIGFIDMESQQVVIVCGNNTGLVLESIEFEGQELKPIQLPISLTKRLS